VTCWWLFEVNQVFLQDLRIHLPLCQWFFDDALVQALKDVLLACSKYRVL
jgi:hypothetical protein